jgi:nucleoside-diphosphate-sugar epimerase
MNLANLRRHAVDIRLVPPAKLLEERLDSDIDLIVNFAHPFSRRDNLSSKAQTDLFVRFLRAARGRNARLKLIHLSTMSVYEPFAQACEFGEAAPLNPPAGDGYATAKLHAERAIRGLPEADRWQLILRPTVVYGPFCRPWTDGPMQAFAAGDVSHRGLTGRIQPLWGGDLSRFILRVIDDFRPGVCNVSGEETVTWMDFMNVFQEVVGRGRLVHVSGPAGPEPMRSGALDFFAQHLRALKRDVVRHPSFLAIAGRVARPFPLWFIGSVERFVGLDRSAAAKASAAALAVARDQRFAQPFFSEDRLVSRAQCLDRCPGFHWTSLRDTRDTLRRYFEYRFTDRLYV